MDAIGPFTMENHGRYCNARKQQKFEERILETGPTWPVYFCNMANGENNSRRDIISVTEGVT